MGCFKKRFQDAFTICFAKSQMNTISLALTTENLLITFSYYFEGAAGSLLLEGNFIFLLFCFSFRVMLIPEFLAGVWLVVFRLRWIYNYEFISCFPKSVSRFHTFSTYFLKENRNDWTDKFTFDSNPPKWISSLS